MKVYVGGAPVTLRKNDFVGRGGEGEVYARGSVAFKIYTDPSHALPPAKFQELEALTAPEIIRPTAIVTNKRGKPLGYTMRALVDPHPLCKLFTKTFKTRHGLDPNLLIKLVQNMRHTMAHVHAAGVLVVDANEMNYLVDAGFTVVHSIDVDSYQTEHYPATAIMASVRDRHSSSFDKGTDWFSWAVVTFQLLTGIHPFKGRHKTIKGLDARMLQNVSVLGPDVSVPAVCPRWEDAIPANYLDWYRAVFQDGKRVAPPADLVAAFVVSAPTVKVVTGTNHFEIHEIADFGAEILFVSHGVRPAVVTTAGVTVNGKLDSSTAGRFAHFAATRYREPLVAWKDSGGVHFREPGATDDIVRAFGPDGLISYRGTVYQKLGDALHEVVIREMGTRTIIGTEHRANVMKRATQLFDGVAIQDMLGAWYATILPEPGVCYNVHLSELLGFKIIDAKFDAGVLMVLGSKAGVYSKFIYRFSGAGYATHCRIVADPAYTELNFTVLDSGICAHLLEDGKLELFHSNPKSSDVKVIEDPVIQGDMVLSNDGATVRFARGSKLYSLKTR